MLDESLQLLTVQICQGSTAACVGDTLKVSPHARDQQFLFGTLLPCQKLCCVGATSALRAAAFP